MCKSRFSCHQVNTKFFFKLRQTDTETHEILETAYRNTALSQKHICEMSIIIIVTIPVFGL
jgi:hypothetical protein